jgi:hypothetical protein
MSTIRIRKPIAGAFLTLILLSAYLGLTTNKIPQYGHSDKGLHFITFFLLTVSITTSSTLNLHTPILFPPPNPSILYP